RDLPVALAVVELPVPGLVEEELVGDVGQRDVGLGDGDLLRPFLRRLRLRRRRPARHEEDGQQEKEDGSRKRPPSHAPHHTTHDFSFPARSAAPLPELPKAAIWEGQPSAARRRARKLTLTWGGHPSLLILPRI